MLIAASFAAAVPALADYDDFESFTANQSINGQGEWTVEDSFGNSGELFDEEIVDLSGNQVWRISNSYASTSYSNQPFSSKPDLIAGETGAQLYNDYGTNHTLPNTPPLSSGAAASKYFYGAWDFKSATGTAQTGMSITASAGASQSTLRMSYLSMVDTGAGFDLVFYDTTGSSFNGPTTIATGLNYTDWHRVEMLVEFVDGIDPGNVGNDIVKIKLDGSVIHTGTTWESYFYTTSGGGFTAPTVHAVDSVLFRTTAANAANDGNGFYFDNVEVSNAVPEPASLGLIAIGGLLLAKRRKHTH